jgi:HK97 family phage portal protein
MSLWSRIFGTESRALAPSDPYWTNYAIMRGIGGTSPDAVLSNLAVAARCVSLRSEIMASVPLHLYRRTSDGGRERADDNPLYGVLHDAPNPNMSAFEFRELLTRCLDLNGNAFARIERNSRAQVTALWPMLPGDVSIDVLPNGRLRFKRYDGTTVETLLQDEVLHIRAATRDGVLGLSPIAIARGALTLAITHAHTALNLSQNAFRPSGILSYQQMLTGPQKDALRQGAAAEYGGAENAGKLMIADGGAKFEQLSFSPEDSEFLDQRKMSNEDTARIFGVPPTAAGLVDKATYSNTEQEARALVSNCIGPLAGRIEAAMGRCLLTEAGRRTYYVEHDLDGLLRGDVKARFEAYRMGRECGVYSANDCRRLENEPPIPGDYGNTFHMPSNWTQLGPGAVPVLAGREVTV